MLKKNMNQTQGSLSLYPQADKKRQRAVFNHLILHLHPSMVPEKTLRFTHTWGLGGMAVVLVMLLVLTGVLLKFVYEPFPGKAYDSIITLQKDVLFGPLVRNIHHWSANLLVIVAFLHMLRVFFTGAFHPPRRFNWILGLGLFFIVLVSNFTGYLLPWDQLSFWAITICTGMVEYIPLLGPWLQKMIRGGAEVGPATISIFYTLHTAIMPACIFILMAFHFWRVRKDGGVVIPRYPEETPAAKEETGRKYVSTIPNLVLRELVVALVLVAVVLVFSTFFNAPLQEKANPGLSPNPAKAPWYFMGFQELLLHFHPLAAILIIPLLAAAALIGLSYLKYDARSSGVWFQSKKGRRMGIFAALTALVITPLGVIADEYFIDFAAWLPGVPSIISTGLLPLSIVAAVVTGFYQLVRKRYTSSNNEDIQAVFIFLLVSFIILTIIGVWFRGTGMALKWL
jgi:quinol-cytochrome oxidoreductase complex cytochrome b subunit